MENRNFECVLFDLDGTLVDTLDLIVESFQHTVRLHLGLEVERDYVVATIGRPLRDCLDELSPGQGEILLATYRDHNLAYHDERARVYPGVLETISSIRASGLKTGIVTSKGRRAATRAVELFRLDALMDVVVCLEDSPRPKPNPDPVLVALEQVSGQPNRALFVGDSTFDIESGRQAGVWTAAALWGAGERDALIASQPHYQIERIEELLDICLNRSPYVTGRNG